MEGRAVSDGDGDGVPMDWGKFWFSRSSCKDHMSQDQGCRVWEGQGLLFLLWVHSWSVQVLSWSQQSCHHPGNEMPVCWISVSAEGQRDSAPTCLVPRYSKSATWPSLGAVGMAGSCLCSLTARRPENRHISEINADLHSGQTYWLPEKNCLPGALAALCL